MPLSCCVDTDTDNGLASASAEAAHSGGAELVLLPDGATRKPRSPRADTPEQSAIREAFGCLTGLTLPDPPLKAYSGIMGLVKTHGIPAVREWCTHLRSLPSGVPEGADPWAYFSKEFRGAMKRPWEWCPKSSGPRRRGEPPAYDPTIYDDPENWKWPEDKSDG